MATLTNAAAAATGLHQDNDGLDIHQNRDILAEILNMSMSDLSMSLDMELQQQPQQQRRIRRQERIRKHLPLSQPQPQRKHPPPPASSSSQKQQQQQPRQDIPIVSSAPRALQLRISGDEITCCTDLLDDEQVTAKPLLKTKSYANTITTTANTRPLLAAASKSTGSRPTASGSQQRPVKSRKAASTAARATSPMQRKQQQQHLQQQQQRRFLRIFSRNRSPPPPPPSSPPPLRFPRSLRQQQMDQELPPLQSFDADGSLVPSSYGGVPTTDSITSLDALRRQRSLVRMSIQLRAPQFLRRPATDPRDAMKLMKSQSPKEELPSASPNSVLEFRAFQSNSDISKSSSIHWSQEEQDDEFQDDDDDDYDYEEEREHKEQDHVADDVEDGNVESSDVYESPVGMLRVHSFPYLGRAADDGNVDDDAADDEDDEDEDEDEDLAKTDDENILDDPVDKVQGDEEEEEEEDHEKVSYELPRSMQTVEDSKADAKNDAVAPSSQQPMPFLFVTPDGFPVLDATDSMDTEIASNVTVSASASIASSTASSSGLRKNTKKTTFSKAASENGFFNSSRNEGAANHPRFQQPPFTNKASKSSPQSAKMYQQLWGNVTQRVSGLSIDAGNLLKPIHACTSPPLDHFLVEHDDDNNGTNSQQHDDKSTSKRVILSCTSGCTALGEEFGAFEPSPATVQPLGSTPAGFQAMYSPNSQYSSSNRAPRRADSEPPSLRRPSRGSTIEEQGEEEEACPSTEVTLEVTYPSKSQTNSGVMALGEKCDTTRGEVVVKVAMLSQRDPSPSTSLNRKRQIVSAAKRWSARQPKPSAPEDSPAESIAAEAIVAADAVACAEDLVPMLQSSSDNCDAFAQLPCQPVLSFSSTDESYHRSPPPPSSLANTSRNTSRWLPPRPSEPVLCSTPSLLAPSEDEECDEDAGAGAPQAQQEGHPSPTVAESAPSTLQQDHHKGIRISPVSITEFRDAL